MRAELTPIEERIARLEKAEFGTRQEPSRDDWQKSVGMFRGDPVMKEILNDVSKARHQEREQEAERSIGQADGILCIPIA